MNIKKNKIILIRFNLKSFHIKLLNNILQKIFKKAKILNIPINGIVALPLRIKRFTVLKSPHVYKTAREQFELKIHHRAFTVFFDLSKPSEKKKAKLFINFVKNFCGGLHLKITYNNFFEEKQKIKNGI